MIKVLTIRYGIVSFMWTVRDVLYDLSQEVRFYFRMIYNYTSVYFYIDINHCNLCSCHTFGSNNIIFKKKS